MKKWQRLIAWFSMFVMLWGMCPGVLAATKGKVNENKVFFRTAPRTTSAFFYRLNKGDQVEVLGNSGNFYKVKVDGTTGYVMKKYVTLAGQQSSSSSSTSSSNSSSSSTTNKGMAGIKKISDIEVPATSRPGDSGQDVVALQQALTLKGFYKGEIDGDYGDKTKEAVIKFQKSKSLSRDGIAGAVTIKALFGKPARTVTTAKPTVKPTAKPAVTPKPAAKPTATPKPSASSNTGMNGIKKISDIEVPGTSRPGDSGKYVVALQQALKLKGFYKGSIDGDYGDATKEAVQKFQKSKGLARDGIAGAVTIKALFGKKAKTVTTATPKATATPKVIKTERLDWFNGGANKIPRGATFQIKDIATGKVFTVRRWAGANHIDAEPKTAEDTATMKAIYGGSWSWARRSILVKYNGHVYAASMNGMPHGTTTINNNNFDGHFCIHFYKSRTHETNRVDENHQKAEERASRYSW